MLIFIYIYIYIYICSSLPRKHSHILPQLLSEMDSNFWVYSSMHNTATFCNLFLNLLFLSRCFTYVSPLVLDFLLFINIYFAIIVVVAFFVHNVKKFQIHF